MRYAVEIESKTYAVSLPDSFFNGVLRTLTVDGKDYKLSMSRVHGTVILTDDAGVERMLRIRRFVSEKFDGEASTRVSVELLASAAEGIRKAAMTVSPDVPGQAQRARAAAASDLVLRSQITGKVLTVDVKVGDTVTQGQTLAVIEAMKMENRIFAPADGTLLSISVKPGDSVATGRELFKIKRA